MDCQSSIVYMLACRIIANRTRDSAKHTTCKGEARFMPSYTSGLQDLCEVSASVIFVYLKCLCHSIQRLSHHCLFISHRCQIQDIVIRMGAQRHLVEVYRIYCSIHIRSDRIYRQWTSLMSSYILLSMTCSRHAICIALS